jgi:hypothetical protein
MTGIQAVRQTCIVSLIIGSISATALAQGLPWGEPTEDDLGTASLPSFKEVKDHKDKTVGGINVYQLDISTQAKDLKGVEDELGAFSRTANENKTFTGELDLTLFKGSARLAVLADDSATVTVNPGGLTLAANGGALWNPASFQTSEFVLAGQAKYQITVVYHNGVHWIDNAKNQEDVDGVTLYAFSSTGIYNRWIVDTSDPTNRRLKLWSGGTKTIACFSGADGLPSVCIAEGSKNEAGVGEPSLDLPVTKETNIETSPPAKSLNQALPTAPLPKSLQYIPVIQIGDEVHHIIPHTHMSVKAVRDAAMAKGIDITLNHHNLVCLPSIWHQQNTKQPAYFKEVNDKFMNCVEVDDFYQAMDELAADLLKRSGKSR